MLLYNSIRGVGSLSQGFQAKKSGIRQVGFVPPPPSPSIGVGIINIHMKFEQNVTSTYQYQLQDITRACLVSPWHRRFALEADDVKGSSGSSCANFVMTTLTQIDAVKDRGGPS